MPMFSNEIDNGDMMAEMLGAGEEDSQVAEAGCKQVSDSKGHGKRVSVAGAALLLCLICGINRFAAEEALLVLRSCLCLICGGGESR